MTKKKLLFIAFFLLIQNLESQTQNLPSKQNQLNKAILELEEVNNQISTTEQYNFKVLSAYKKIELIRQNKLDDFTKAKDEYERANQNIDLIPIDKINELATVLKRKEIELKQAEKNYKLLQNKKEHLDSELKNLKNKKIQKEIEILEIRADMFRNDMQKAVWVIGNGESIMDETKSMNECKQIALDNAKKDAIEKGGKAIIRSITQVDMFQLTKDEITMTANVQIVAQDNSGDYGKIKRVPINNTFKFVVTLRLKVQSIDNYNPFQERIKELKGMVNEDNNWIESNDNFLRKDTGFQKITYDDNDNFFTKVFLGSLKTKKFVNGLIPFVGYHNTFFLNDHFKESMKDGLIINRGGIIAGIKLVRLPFLFHINYLQENFQTSQFVLTPTNIKLKGTNISTSIALFPVIKYFIPYVGGGYQFSALSADKNIQAVISSPYYFGAIQMNFGEFLGHKWTIEVNYNKSFSGKKSRDWEQASLSIGFNLSKSSINKN